MYVLWKPIILTNALPVEQVVMNRVIGNKFVQILEFEKTDQVWTVQFM